MHHFVSHQRRGWGGSLSRTGDDDLPLHTQRGQGAADISALLDAVFIEAALFVLLRAAQLLPGTGVTQEIEKHRRVTIPFRSYLVQSSSSDHAHPTKARLAEERRGTETRISSGVLLPAASP